MKPKQDNSAAFVFVCQGGEIEIEALLLAQSLKLTLPANCELIAAVPTPFELMPSPDPIILRALNDLGVRVERIFNPIVEKRRTRIVNYLLTNKIFALTVPTSADSIIFLDSDQFCWDARQIPNSLPVPIVAHLLDPYGARAMARAWEAAFQVTGVPMPYQRFWHVADLDGERLSVLAPPAFNSSFVALDAAIASEFAEMWADCFERIDRAGIMVEGPMDYHMEEAAFAVAVAKSRQPFWMANHGPIFDKFSHYIRPERVCETPYLLKFARQLAAGWPELRQLPAAQQRWSFLWTSDGEQKSSE